ncbi:FecR family protein [Pseudomonas sp. JQ170]|uniref:FecR domain-containing protein n=1 Tax=unclassified Pseudomonas TaxID=196821 RepID=UPI000F9F310B|nr:MULTISPECIES: FecR family protein [unclassified Pseudomonas]MDN7143202.1 FecR family protein [Pseudomonas sp. JQ170]WRO74452.1 FecR family protein [Pseudomonas sp. 170C]
MNGAALPSLPPEVVDQAIEWSIRLNYNQPDPATRLAFDAWLARADTHRLAWARIQSLGGRFAGVPSELAMQALEKLPEARLQRRQLLNLLSVFAAVGVTAWTTRQTLPWQRLQADYSTQVGERGRWDLADGSLLELNTDSAVRLRFDAMTRDIELLRGELHLISGADTDSPTRRALRVSTALGTFEALGTRFSVRLEAQSCRLSVTEGAVRMQPQAGTAAVAQAGEIWQLDAAATRRLTGDAAESAAWRDGVLAVRDMPLTDVLQELGRYRNGYLGCAPDIARRPISGNFNLTDTDATLAFLAQAHGLQLHSLTRYWVRLSA